ncbi:hypothetical protein PHYPO_G00239550 [Pangasianodon hypophthalmus]|uniref:Ig-like domain-containing protein n=1 Tax=Pangasianodon hypophthalmus TaxID=310915 RepID=A0A5N5NFI6_PANHP|nr:hypothetical protein PHYPO_G00239550 [Pangasianodon hypophthalmus]
MIIKRHITGEFELLTVNLISGNRMCKTYFGEHQRLFWKTTCLCVCILCSVKCVGSRPIPAREGLSAILPCKFNNTSVQTPHIRWCTDSEVVVERRGAELYEGSGYEGRVDVPEDELHKGNCSLVLKRVRKSDEGIYKCYPLLRRAKRSASPEWSLIQSVELSVDVPKETPKKPTATDNARVDCLHPLVMAVSLLSCLLFSKETL